MDFRLLSCGFSQPRRQNAIGESLKMTVFICGVPASPARGLGFISPISPGTLCACKRIEVPKPRQTVQVSRGAARWTDAHRVPRHTRTEETFPRPRFFGLDVSKKSLLERECARCDLSKGLLTRTRQRSRPSPWGKGYRAGCRLSNGRLSIRARCLRCRQSNS
jgi:hypothetical protein